ncbi:MAG TPA: GNAT family N-acetyltransferase [Thermohalobaculum sp.]|nr:GNAT family N-acetyltransferase [Thermohalobaculum sp.]
MAVKQPGETISYIVTYLEMTARPATQIPPTPAGPLLALIRAEAPPAHYFLYLYRAVGAAFEWTDWLARGEDEVEAFLSDAGVELFTLFTDGWPGGFFVLDTREAGVCELAYFGLVPEARGRGLARWLLASAVHGGWDRPGVAKMTVNTNTLDHPRAITLYQWAGFAPVRREEETRTLTRPRQV